MAGLDRPTAGEVLVDGQPIQNLSEDQLAVLRRHKVGFVFQSFQLLTNLTARENVLLPVELLGQPDPVGRANELLAAVGLGERGHHYPSQLSGGEQQRGALARAFAAPPPPRPAPRGGFENTRPPLPDPALRRRAAAVPPPPRLCRPPADPPRRRA